MAQLGKKHVVTVTFYAYGTQKEVMKEANKICDEINKKHDNRATVEKLHQKVIGCYKYKQIGINN